MRTKFVIGTCLAAGFAALAAFGADTRSLVGATRDQITARFGEPKSHIVAGNREVLIFATERVVLRDGRAIEIDDLPTEPAPAPVAPPANAAPTTSGGGETNAEPTSSAVSPAQPATDRTKSNSASGATATPSDEASGNATVAAVPPPPQVVIKSVRPPSHTVAPAPVVSPSAEAKAPITTSEPSAAPVSSVPSAATAASPNSSAAAIVAPTAPPTPTAGSVPSSASVPVASSDVASPGPAAVPSASTASPTAEPRAANEGAATAPATTPTEPATTPAAPVVATTPTPDVATAAKATPPAAAPVNPRRTDTSNPTAVATPPTRSIPYGAIAAALIVAGIGYLLWRRRQRAALLAATAVSRSPFPAAAAVIGTAAPVAAGTRFTIDLLEKLEWKRFEELVASYYNKTGVVATRTKTGPMTPVHIRISWKGEQRPFACVQCHAHPAGLIDARPVQTLVDALAAEDIRRGYIVTSGKFGVPARDLAEEKHITLLSGEILLEKLNALPEPARAELLRDATTGDYSSPTCPTCESKMTRSLGESAWTCPQCGTTLARG